MRSLRLACFVCVPLFVACAGGDDLGAPDDGESETPGRRSGGSEDPGEPTSPSEGGQSTPGVTAGVACTSQPACDGSSAPPPSATRPWKQTLSSLIVLAGSPYHRGRDQIVNEGEPQWIIGKFTYSLIDKDLKGEDVDIWVERGCAGAWEKLGTATTTKDGVHATVEGVEDSGGRVYFEIPKAKALPLGRHRVRMIVAGDNTSTDLIMDIVPKGQKILVTDVDGTLTEGEYVEYTALLTGAQPKVQPNAPEVLTTLAKKGYHPLYLTARPEWLTGRTREFITERGLPPGVIHTTTGLTGGIGAAAVTFKSAELAMLNAKGLSIAWAFGNQPSDTDAYDDARIMPTDHRVFLRQDDAHGGRRIEAYSEVLADVSKSPAACK